VCQLNNLEAISLPGHFFDMIGIKTLDNIVFIADSLISEEIISTVLSYCERPATFDEILSRICKKYKIDLNANQYVLISNTIKSYLSFLGEEGKLGMSFS